MSLAAQERALALRAALEAAGAQPVETGGRSGGKVTILSGLEPGKLIATANAFVLKAELGKEGASHGH